LLAAHDEGGEVEHDVRDHHQKNRERDGIHKPLRAAHIDEVDDAGGDGIHLTGADDGRDAVAGGRGDKDQQPRRNNGRRHHRQRDRHKGSKRRSAGDFGGLLKGGVHLLHGAGNRDKGIGIIKRGQHPDHAADRLDVERQIGQAEDGGKNFVEGSDRRIKQFEPCHGADVGRNHISHDKQGAEKFFEIQVGSSNQPCERKGDEHA